MNDTEHRHASYGMVQICRHTSNRGVHLFGSAVADHFQTFSLRVSHGMAYSDDESTGELRFRADGRIVEVEMSAAQFVELMTTHNVGDGVPCTITRLGGQLVDDPPRPKTDVERAHAAFEKRMGSFGRKLDALVVEVEKAAAKLPKKDREALQRAAGAIQTEVASNIPYFLRTFTEAAERIVSAKKTEVEAWVSAVVRAAGMEHIRALAPKDTEERQPLQLKPAEPMEQDDGTEET